MINNSLPKTLLPFIWCFLKPYKLVLIIFIFLGIAAGLWGPFNSMLTKELIDLLTVSTNDFDALFWLAALIPLNFIIFDNVTWRGISYIEYKYGGLIKNRIITKVTDYLLKESSQFFQNRLSGYIAKQVNTLADNVEIILFTVAPNILRGASLLITSLIPAYYTDSIFFIVMIIWSVIFFVFSVLASKKFTELADKHADSESVVSGQLVDVFSNHHNVMIFANKKFEHNRMLGYLNTTLKMFKDKNWLLLIIHAAQAVSITIMFALTTFSLVFLYKKSLIKAGDFALILGLVIHLGYTMWYTMYFYDEFNKAYGKCKQSLKALTLPLEIIDKPDAANLICDSGNIIFDNVKFNYKGSEALFENISLQIKAGQKVGFVGYSGGGKSTFVNLILRLYDVNAGAILIDGQDIREITQDSLRQNIAMIPQDPSLFHRSLMENIRYGRIDATDEEVIEAAKKAHAHEFIEKLPQGYDSLVGERGVKLSGGQRQRIAIARAILKNAPILILDEATSQLDSLTENLIQDSLWKLMQNKTTIVIAHRLSTLLHMDRILVFDKGKIVEDGSHEELLAKDGLYKHLWGAQVGGFLGDEISQNPQF